MRRRIRDEIMGVVTWVAVGLSVLGVSTVLTLAVNKIVTPDTPSSKASSPISQETRVDRLEEAIVNLHDVVEDQGEQIYRMQEILARRGAYDQGGE
jgi:hypothetical protein